MATNIRSGASDGALQLNGVDIVTFNSTGIIGGLINASSAEVAARTNSTKAITPLGLQSLLVSGTAQNTTSGTAIDFTGISSWAKRITVMFNGVSTNGTSIVQVQLGNGAIVTTGYSSVASGFASSSATTFGATSGIITGDSSSGAMTRIGNIYLTTLGNNIWTVTGSFALPTIGQHVFSGGLTLSGTLDRIRLTTVNGTDLFDAGSVNLLWE